LPDPIVLPGEMLIESVASARMGLISIREIPPAFRASPEWLLVDFHSPANPHTLNQDLSSSGVTIALLAAEIARDRRWKPLTRI
jgi:hypothetical protein